MTLKWPNKDENMLQMVGAKSNKITRQLAWRYPICSSMNSCAVFVLIAVMTDAGGYKPVETDHTVSWQFHETILWANV